MESLQFSLWILKFTALSHNSVSLTMLSWNLISISLKWNLQVINRIKYYNSSGRGRVVNQNWPVSGIVIWNLKKEVKFWQFIDSRTCCIYEGDGKFKTNQIDRNSFQTWIRYSYVVRPQLCVRVICYIPLQC